ncbi:MAG: TfoX/Sxy family DNA transformation protein [Planctomycetota bacterium]
MNERLDERCISEMRNLGPCCERDLSAVGITTAANLKQIGVEEAFRQLLIGRRQRGLEVTCCNAAYLYALHGAVYDLDWRELPEDLEQRYKDFAAEMRQSIALRGRG